MSLPGATVLDTWHHGLDSRDDAVRMASAKAVAGFMQDRIFGRSARLPPVDQETASSTALARSVQYLSCATDAALAPQGDVAFAELQMFFAACDRMLDDIMNVGQFGEPVAHRLFCLVETGIAGELVRSLRNSHNWIGRQREADLVTARGTHVHSSVSDGAVLAACIARAYGVLGGARLHETAGFTHGLYVAVSGPPGGARILGAGHSVAADWAAGAASASDGSDPGSRDAALRGLQALEFCCRLLAEASTRTKESVRHMACQIIRKKATYAVLHHKGQVLGPRRVVEWFAAQPFDAQGMLDALHASPWIDRDDVRRSRFFVELNGPTGKMHRVFSAPEIDVLVRHFEHLGAEAPPVPNLEGAFALQVFAAWTAQTKAESFSSEPLDLSAVRTSKDRYFALLYAEPRGTAQLLATRTVASALREALAVQASVGLPAFCSAFDYSPQELESRVDQAYKARSEKTGLARALPCTAEVRAKHLRFAPMALIDGCWLHRITALRRESPALMLLHGIFADEVGNGVSGHNHANLYVALLKSLDIDIESATAESMRNHPQIPVQAFRLPAFLLALGVVSPTHIPEVLGATLAIELSGLDEFYDAMIDDLEAMQKDASFWRVHVSIDNYSSGHARQALQAIVLHMEELLQRHGEGAARPVWQRIWHGFASTTFLLGVEMSVVAGTPGKAVAS